MTNTNTIKHWACDFTTGEVLGCSTSNQLKRRVKKITAYERAEGFYGHKWVFFHGTEGEMRAWIEMRV